MLVAVMRVLITVFISVAERMRCIKNLCEFRYINAKIVKLRDFPAYTTIWSLEESSENRLCFVTMQWKLLQDKSGVCGELTPCTVGDYEKVFLTF